MIGRAVAKDAHTKKKQGEGWWASERMGGAGDFRVETDTERNVFAGSDFDGKKEVENE